MIKSKEEMFLFITVRIWLERNWVLATNSDFQIAISLKPDGVWTKIIHILKYLRSLTLKCKDIGIRKSEFVTKTQFQH